MLNIESELELKKKELLKQKDKEINRLNRYKCLNSTTQNVLLINSAVTTVLGTSTIVTAFTGFGAIPGILTTVSAGVNVFVGVLNKSFSNKVRKHEGRYVKCNADYLKFLTELSSCLKDEKIDDEEFNKLINM